MKDSTTPLPAPAGEPEMPANAAYWWSPKDGAMAGTWSSNTGPHPDWDVTHYFTADQLRAYGDARAEHARRVAPGFALVPLEPTESMFIEGMEADCLGRPSIDDETHVRSIWNAMLRAAAPPQGEPK